MGDISVVINTLNEEKTLPRAISSVAEFADEVIVVDMKSDDKTREVAKKSGAKVYLHDRTGYVEPARNFAISKANKKWILVLDADEEIPNTLAAKLKKISSDSGSADFYRLPRKNIIFGKWIRYSRWWPDYNIRFFKNSRVTWNELIHSVPMTRGRGADLRAKESNAVVHHHYNSVEQYVERINRYTNEHAKLKIKEGYKFEWSDLIQKPAGEFLSRFFQGEGYRDGIHGLALAGLQAVSEFVMYLKIWEQEKFRSQIIDAKDLINELKTAESEAHYWQADSLLKDGSGLIQRIKRRFRLF